MESMDSMEFHGVQGTHGFPWIPMDFLKRRTVHGDLIRLVIRFTTDFFVDFRIRLDWVGLGWIGKGTETFAR